MTVMMLNVALPQAISLLLGTPEGRSEVNAKALSGCTALDLAQMYDYDSPHPAGRALRDAGGRTTDNPPWYAEHLKWAADMVGGLALLPSAKRWHLWWLGSHT